MKPGVSKSMSGPKMLAITLSMLVAGCTGTNATLQKSGNVMQNQTRSVKVNSENISFREVGNGPLLVLLQRFRGGLNDWDPALIAALSKSNKVLFFDSVGVGESDGEVPETLEGSADFVIGLLDALDIEQANILGWSLGGMVAQILAVRFPERIDKIILAGTTPPAGSADVQLAPDEWTAIATKPENSVEDMAYLFYTETATGLKAAQNSQRRFEMLDSRGVGTKTKPAIIMKQALSAREFISNASEWYARLGDIHRPVLVAGGDSDIAFPVMNSMVLHREIPNSELVIYPDAGHAFLFQYAERFAQDVKTFLRNK